MNARYAELCGRLEAAPAGTRSTAPAPTVVVSRLVGGAACSPAWDGLSVRYVARGVEVYRIAGRTYRLREGEFMLSPQALGGEAEIPRASGAATLGLCLFYPGRVPPGHAPDAPALPVVLAASGSTLGRLLARQLAELMRPLHRAVDAAGVLQAARPHVAGLALELARQAEAVDGARVATRYEAVRRAHAARAHLHDTVDRAVPLAELARVAGLSPFQLARTFRDCFGEAPARYHRALRLELVRAELVRTGATWQVCCERYGFAGGSSFSHAWRRTFGCSPRDAERGAGEDDG